jgi:RNA polymerase sigma-70 factor, ECF subfamily
MASIAAWCDLVRLRRFFPQTPSPSRPYLAEAIFFSTRFGNGFRAKPRGSPRLDLRRGAPKTQSVQRTCQAWLDDLGPGSGPARESALSDLRDLLRRSLGRSFGGKFSDDDLDDLTQESLLRIHERLHTFEKRSRFTTWAVSIAVNGAYSELRRRRHQHVSLEDAMQQGAASLVQTAETHREPDREGMLRDAINLALTPRQRDAMLALLGGLPLAEMARRLSTSQGAIYKLLHDARRRLKHHLEAQERATPIPHQAKGDPP